jgi:hypothetical protein
MLVLRPLAGSVRTQAGDMTATAPQKVTWQEVGRVAEPGRYLFRFGWLTVTAADIAIWQRHPDAALTLVAGLPGEITDEYHLGVFDFSDPPRTGSRTTE